MSNLDIQLQKFSKTKRFKELVANAQREAIKAGKPFGTGGDAISPQYIEKKCEEMKQILFKEVVPVIPSITPYDIEIGKPTLGENGCCEVNIGFNRERVHRDSLWSSKYDGVDNIILLFTHGYSAGERVYGTWHGEQYASRMNRTGSDFMERAVSVFNEQNSTTKAELDDIYKR